MSDTEVIKPDIGDALIIVDVQIDFLPGGNLPVSCGDEVIPVLNNYIALFTTMGLPVFATRDWHTPDHCSFKNNGGIWPPHCIVDTTGARFAATLQLPDDVIIISKAATRETDAYSGFEGTTLAGQLREAGITRLFVGGLATDYCVLNTVKDALSEGFKVVVLQDAIRAVNVHPDDGKQAEKEMRRLGAEAIEYQMIAIN